MCSIGDDEEHVTALATPGLAAHVLAAWPKDAKLGVKLAAALAGKPARARASCWPPP